MPRTVTVKEPAAAARAQSGLQVSRDLWLGAVCRKQCKRLALRSRDSEPDASLSGGPGVHRHRVIRGFPPPGPGERGSGFPAMARRAGSSDRPGPARPCALAPRRTQREQKHESFCRRADAAATPSQAQPQLPWRPCRQRKQTTAAGNAAARLLGTAAASSQCFVRSERVRCVCRAPEAADPKHVRVRSAARAGLV